MTRRALFAAIVLGALVSTARAHPIHASTAELDYRPAPARLEIALRLFTDDAEAALTASAGKKIKFGATPAAELDALLFALVRRSLAVKSRDAAAQPLAWVGRELKDGDQHLWVYLTCPLPGGTADATIADAVLRETFSDQLNSLRLRDHSVAPARQKTLLFLDAHEQAITWP